MKKKKNAQNLSRSANAWKFVVLHANVISPLLDTFNAFAFQKET